MEIKKINIDSQFPLETASEIEALAKGKLFSPIWQTIWWNMMLQKTSYSKKWIFLWIYDEDELVNYAIIEKRKVWFWMFWNFIIWWPHSDIWINKLENELKKIWKEENAVFTQIENLDKMGFHLFKKGWFKKFIERHTAIINLMEDEEKILSNMKQKWRYNIKIAQKNGINVEKVESNKENVETFYNLLTETKDRWEFAVNSSKYFFDFCSYLEENSLWGLYFAKKDDEVLAAWIFVFFWKIAIYYYWASTSDNEKRKYMPAYLLQWNIIQESKKMGFEVFDFLWIADPEDKDSKLAWVTDFKMKLTNEIHIFPESKILIHSKLKYLLLLAKNELRKYLK
ncbi:MAG: FemAB family protein [uncultured bacterium (gcode 4)]|uniref:FemAB family protein n=1 Tax=uncultured bacterium (gcode 4) TaxID=1234023 RepID=K2F9J0_9BACT|nr:MAG: FemAB family protein [uncultured bacterium (gcode 4)]